MLLQAGYSRVYLWRQKNGQTSIQQKTLMAWTEDPKCCGPGSYIPEACRVANMTWRTRADGKEDLIIFDPKDPTNPILTLNGLWRPFLPYLVLPFPNSELWGVGLLRPFFNDIVPLTNGTLGANGKPIITGYVEAVWDGMGTWTPAVMDSIGGSNRVDVPGLWNIGFSAFGAVRTWYKPISA